MDDHKSDVQDGIFALGEKNTAYQKYFKGQSYLQSLVSDPNINVSVSNVSFEPGCRNNWHQHIGGFQILLATAGVGWYQEEGKAPRKLRPGDVVVVHDSVKHWHGATKDSWFAHIAITAGTPKWLEPVTDEEYQKLED